MSVEGRATEGTGRPLAVLFLRNYIGLGAKREEPSIRSTLFLTMVTVFSTGRLNRLSSLPGSTHTVAFSMLIVQGNQASSST